MNWLGPGIVAAVIGALALAFHQWWRREQRVQAAGDLQMQRVREEAAAAEVRRQNAAMDRRMAEQRSATTRAELAAAERRPINPPPPSRLTPDDLKARER